MDENKNTIIIAICALCLFMTLMIACSRGCSSKPEKRVVKPIPEKVITPQQKEEPEYKEQYSPSRSSYSYSPSRGNPPALLSEEDKAILAKKYKKNREELAKIKRENIERQLKDPNLSEDAKEQIRFRANPNFLKGMEAQRNHDYKSAVKYFNEILVEKNSTPISKYFACSSIMEVAMRMKDMELYFIAYRMRAKLEAEENLTSLGIQKNNHALEWCDKVENSLKARNDPKYFDICVKLKLANVIGPITKEMEKYAKSEVEKDIEAYSKQFKELIE